MKATPIFLILLFSYTHTLFAGQSKLTPILWSPTINCCGQATYSVEVQNINPTFAIENIDGTFVVTRQSQVIYEETNVPRNSDLSPGEKQTFQMTIPMELLLLDGLIEIFFEFGSDFDLNTDPTASLDAFITGCGVTQAVASGLILAALGAQAEEREAYIFLFQQLLKPGTIIKGSGTDVYTKQLAAFTWMATVFNPFIRFGQPVQVALLNSNTEEIEVIDAEFPPIIFEEVYTPDEDSDDKILGELPLAFPPPKPFTIDEVSSMPVDSVCAILVSGDDSRKSMRDGFLRDVDLIKKTLTRHMAGPRLPETSLLIRSAMNGYNRDSLIQDLQALKNKYKKVYFFYSGHSSKEGKMILGLDDEDDLDYTTFVDELFDSGAKNYCIMIDACYSGIAVHAVSNHPNVENLDVEIITSSNDSKTSAAEVWSVDNMNQYFGKFTSQFFWAMGDAFVDQNHDGKVSFFEAFKKVNDDNFSEITDLQCPVGKAFHNNTITTIGHNVFQASILQYGPVKLDHANIYVNPIVLPAGTIVQSFDQSQSFVFPASGYFSWIEWNSNALFGKEVTYSYVDPVSYEVQFMDGLQFWPTMPAFPQYNAFDPANVFTTGRYYKSLPRPVSITQSITAPPDSTEEKIAILVSGSHPDVLYQQALQASVAIFYANLAYEVLGDQFPEENIKTYNDISGMVLLNVLSSYQDEYSKVFFYYAGNSTNTGKLCLGNHPDEWISYTDLLTGIGTINTKGVKLFFDGSYSGQALEYVKQLDVFDGKRLDVFTSADAFSPAYLELHQDQVTTEITGTNFMTLHLMEHYGDPLSEQDQEEGTSHMEAFKNLYIHNPNSAKGVPLFTLSSPKAFARRYVNLGANEPATQNMRSVDLTLTIHQRNAAGIDIHAIQTLDVKDQISSDPKVFSISPVRQWKIEGAWDIDPAFRADLIFHYQEEIDIPEGSEGMLGLVSRTSPDDDWTAWYPSEYNEAEKSITAMNVLDAREWAIARVEEIVGLHDPILNKSAMKIYPNPSTEKINISFDLAETAALSVSIMDLNGKVIYAIDSKLYQAGAQNIEVKLQERVAGIYHVVLASEQGKMALPFVVR